jgi:integrase
VVPTQDEISTIIAHSVPEVAAAVAVLAETGLRVGALVTLKIRPDGSFETVSKGKFFQSFEPLSEAVRTQIEKADLSSFQPFRVAIVSDQVDVSKTESRAVAKLATKISRQCKALYAAGLVSASFSPHDFRHAFAEANASKGLIWLRDRLNHASISVTEFYLRRSLGRNTSAM